MQSQSTLAQNRNIQIDVDVVDENESLKHILQARRKDLGIPILGTRQGIVIKQPPEIYQDYRLGEGSIRIFYWMMKKS